MNCKDQDCGFGKDVKLWFTDHITRSYGLSRELIKAAAHLCVCVCPRAPLGVILTSVVRPFSRNYEILLTLQ